MNIRDLIKRLKENNIDISLNGDKLEISYDGDALPDATLAEIRDHKTRIIDFLKQLQGEEDVAIPRVAPQPGYTLSSTQRRSWIVSQFGQSNVAYNMSNVYVFNGRL